MAEIVEERILGGAYLFRVRMDRDVIVEVEEDASTIDGLRHAFAYADSDDRVDPEHMLTAHQIIRKRIVCIMDAKRDWAGRAERKSLRDRYNKAPLAEL